jgi:hypothetical protein
MINENPSGKIMTSSVPLPSWWQPGVGSIVEYLDKEVSTGKVELLSKSPGGRDVLSVTYGDTEPELRGTANWCSALAAGKPDTYYRRGERKRPVLMIQAGVHGAEPEGVIGATSAISILETGKDISGQPQQELREKLQRMRVIIIPIANPDGRARCPYDGWVGLPEEKMHRVGQGTRADGSLYGWPGCKAVHPMKGDVGFLGCYFDDDGVNLSVDNWGAPMSRTTTAILKLVADEGPDIMFNLHGYAIPPGILPLAYIPMSVKQDIAAFAKCYNQALDTRGIVSHRAPPVNPDGPLGECPPALNQTSIFFHSGAALPITHESPQGFCDAKAAFDYQTILTLHHVLLETAADWLYRQFVQIRENV